MPRKENYRSIFGHHKIRDGRIILTYRDSQLTIKEIAQNFKLCEERIKQILMKSGLLKDKAYMEQMQVRRIEDQIRRKYKDGDSKKDVADLEELLLKLRADKKLVLDNSTHNTHIYQVEVTIDGKEAPIPLALQSRANLPEHSSV